MNKNLINIVSFVAGILTAVSALFFGITGIMTLTYFNGDYSASYNVYIALSAILFIAFTVLLGLLSFFIIKKYVVKNEEEAFERFPVLGYLAFEIIGSILFMIFYKAYDNVLTWFIIVFAIAALVLILLYILKKADEFTASILNLVGIGIAFIVIVMNLGNISGVCLAAYIFMMFTIIAYFVYYLFKMIIKNNQNNEQ